MVTKMGERMGGDRRFLFGRRTYEDLLASWNAQGGPFRDALNNARKYVASSNPRRGSAGRTRRCCTATFRPPWPPSSSARA
jgi:dihydrofolate reductase